MVTVERVTSAEGILIDDINALLTQLRRRPESSLATKEELVSIAGDTDVIFVVAKDDQHLVGMGIVYLIQKFAGKVGFVETIIVLDSYRGKKLGQKIMELLIAEAKKAGAKGLDLTSHPERVAANALYEKLGFEKRETNVYRLRL